MELFGMTKIRYDSDEMYKSQSHGFESYCKADFKYCPDKLNFSGDSTDMTSNGNFQMECPNHRVMGLNPHGSVM